MVIFWILIIAISATLQHFGMHWVFAGALGFIGALAIGGITMIPDLIRARGEL